MAEEKILQGAAIRKKSGSSPLNETPPPLPNVPPPDATPSGAQRLDALIGGPSGNPPPPMTKSNGLSSKKVSFAAPTDDFETDANKENHDEKLSRLEKYEKDPNVSDMIIYLFICILDGIYLILFFVSGFHQ